MFCRKSEHMTSKLETVSNMVNTELSDFDNTPKFSSPETSGFGNHQAYADGSIASGFDKLNGGDKGLARSDRCKEDSLENNEVIYSSQSRDLKMKAPMKSTKLIIKKKQLSADIESPCKLTFVSSKADSIGARGDVISGNLSFTGPNLVTEALEGVNDRNVSSPQPLDSYSDQRSYDHLHERDKSYKREANPGGFDCDLEENTSIFSNHHGLGVAVDPVRQTRSIRLKTNSKEPNALNARIKIRGGQSSRATSSREDSSVKGSYQLHQRTRSTRSRRDEYNANDPGILTRRMSNHHVKKVSSWLMLSEPGEGHHYIPQLGDEVVYLRQVVYVYVISLFSYR